MSEAISNEAMMRHPETHQAADSETPLLGTFVGTMICISMALGLTCVQAAKSVTDADTAGNNSDQMAASMQPAQQHFRPKLARNGAILHLSDGSQCPLGSVQLSGVAMEEYGYAVARPDATGGKNTGAMPWGQPDAITCKI